ncbi:YihY/virulence factor BrkB family protein [Haloarcula onubensis]|uniref:YihY/virulence factor BrkB family protein n=1 Tax=Haloarcula onubensis TaxID=2950539 RepID=A0ABU2FRC9_9EURY|nr:YihY/virulence factor BrkB family protein [Halomicroarcula sp. S3CR25-11]MDS0282711.1 YihY/virulence factor BrkB family protein [Halomicroarcula sp. S3CR25-11]
MARRVLVTRLHGLSSLGRRVFRASRRANLGFMAGSVAFQAFMSLLPLLVSIYLLALVLAGEAVARASLSLAESFLPRSGQAALGPVLTGQVSTATVSAISLAVLLWGAVGLFRTLETAFGTIYVTQRRPSTLTRVTDALVAFVAVLLAILLAVGTASTAVLAYLPAVTLVSSLLVWVGLGIVFLPMYYLFPNRPLRVRDAVPGAVIAALGWSLLQAAFQLYLRFVASPDIAGVVGSVLVLLTWLYYGSYVILFGAVVNATIGERTTADGK